jgi:ATP-dependent RNA helicase DDX24/MAK5
VFTDFNHQFIQAGISPLLQKQLEVLAKRNVNVSSSDNNENKGSRFVIIGQDRVEPLQALQDSGQEVIFSVDIYVITTRIMFEFVCVVRMLVAIVISSYAHLLLILCCQICVNMDKQREKRRLAENWRRKKHEEKKSIFLSSFSSN